MAEVLVEFADAVVSEAGVEYTARACGRAAPEGLWEGWIEFTPLSGSGVLRSGRETTQPNREATIYWATGLTPVYLEGALERALAPRELPSVVPAPVPAYDEPAPPAVASPSPTNSVLNPFSVYRKGEVVLRRQLVALSDWHLINIVRDYGLSDQTADQLARRSTAELIELIVAAVKLQAEPAPVK